jgi:hypothetical protein
MSERALAFVEEWVSDHVHAGEAPGGAGSPAKALGHQCLADASAGISSGEIGESIDDLEDFMAGALEEANERKAHRSGKEEDEGENGEDDEGDEDDDEEDDDDDEDDDEDDEEKED